MALLSDRESFDRLTCQRIRFADSIGKLVAAPRCPKCWRPLRPAWSDPENTLGCVTCDEGYSRDATALRSAAIERYAQWRAYDDAGVLDECFIGIPAADWQAIINVVNGIWDASRP